MEAPVTTKEKYRQEKCLWFKWNNQREAPAFRTQACRRGEIMNNASSSANSEPFTTLVLNQWQFCSLGYIWKLLEIYLIITTGDFH